MNVNILIIFCGILWMQNCVDAQSADCDYGIRNFWTTGYINQNKNYYSCSISTKLQSLINTVTTINGQHNSGHADDDVTYLLIPNGISLNTFSSIYCEKFKNLEVVQSYAAAINSIDGNSLEKCENLDVLDLHGAQLNSIPNELLTRNSKLTQIWIRTSQVTTLPENLFSSQNKLKLLNLKDNQINFLSSNIFNPLIQLESLSLSNNKLQSIDSKWFQNLGNLKKLFLNENQISLVPDKSFEFLINLEELGLYSNRNKLLNSNSFAGLHNLKKLFLYNNEISELSHNTFEPLRNLELLSMYSNKLTIIDAASFGVHKNLVTVGLGNNKINQIDEKFIDNTAVNWINMTGNICSNEVLRGTKIKVGLKTCFENYKTTKIQHEVTRTQQCGQPIKGAGTIIGGRYAPRGNFPWVAVLSTASGDLFCGGTLVSNRKVVTAAHCIQGWHVKSSLHLVLTTWTEKLKSEELLMLFKVSIFILIGILLLNRMMLTLLCWFWT
ncbi:phospholipase A2 inhibitor beta-like [Chironomus tepperi]|uniref:phospholipase A2 inhibitor beta-like n=1 Tax=Chironomus tepperi TaxID=113505 RepID=UPI00391F6C7C